MSGFQLAGWHLTEFSTGILAFLLLALVICALRVFYGTSALKKKIPEATMFVLVGLVLGIILVCVKTDASETLQGILQLPSDVFLQLLVPIILFDAAYFLDKQRFFHNFLEIAVYAVIGTALNTALIGIMMYFTRGKFILHDPGYSFSEIFSFASLISAVDPVSVMAVMEALHVNATLYNIAFGESSLNDGVAIVLYMLFKDLDSLISANTAPGTIVGLGIAKFLIAVAGAVAVGGVVALLFCLLLKIAHRCPITEPLLMLVAAYISFQLADSFLFSGVISIMTCALFLSWYARPNLAPWSRTTFETIVKTIASCAESFLFFDMGVQIGLGLGAMIEAGAMDYIFLVCGLCYTILARAVGVILLTALLNIRRRNYGETITWRDQLIMIQAGLRGAISFSLSISLSIDDEARRQNIVCTTCVIILFTIIVFGLPMGAALKGLHISREPEQKPLTELNMEESASLLAAEAFLTPVAQLRNAVEAAAGLNRCKHAMERGLRRAHGALSSFYINHEVAEEHELARIFERYTAAKVETEVYEDQQVMNGLRDAGDMNLMQVSMERARQVTGAPNQYFPAGESLANVPGGMRPAPGDPGPSGIPVAQSASPMSGGHDAASPPSFSPPGTGPPADNALAGIDPAVFLEAKYQRELKVARASNAEAVMRRASALPPTAGHSHHGSARPSQEVIARFSIQRERQSQQGPQVSTRPAVLSLAGRRRSPTVAQAGDGDSPEVRASREGADTIEQVREVQQSGTALEGSPDQHAAARASEAHDSSSAGEATGPEAGLFISSIVGGENSGEPSS